MALEGSQYREPRDPVRPPAAASHSFELTTAGDAGRAAVEAYIAQKFAATYGARIHSFLPQLLSLHRGGVIDAALGLRRADSGALFLEQYLDRPVERQLAAAAGRPVARSDIVEIGNLVSTSRGSSQMLFLMLAELFAEARVNWAIFTATPEVHKLLSRLTADQIVLCVADGGRLGAQLQNWGSYYDTCPAVTAIDVTASREILLQRPLVCELLRNCAAQAKPLARMFLEGNKCN
ncbi:MULTISPECIES: thermostable hemolysin [unclassified Microbulbifer]|uniref:thermostable hemolysin n=1 Tax=unclassified Microbulbifer TaxID=2619833 RepID=UPI0027E4AAC7|nr:MULTISPECIES: thermostable hemolysin [unclassified Microbulbifer]